MDGSQELKSCCLTGLAQHCNKLLGSLISSIDRFGSGITQTLLWDAGASFVSICKGVWAEEHELSVSNLLYVYDYINRIFILTLLLRGCYITVIYSVIHKSRYNENIFGRNSLF